MLGFVIDEPVVRARVSSYISVSLLQSAKDQCKFPLWSVAEKNGLVCGAKRAHEKSSWCAHHEAIVFKTPPDWSKKK